MLSNYNTQQICHHLLVISYQQYRPAYTKSEVTCSERQSLYRKCRSILISLKTTSKTKHVEIHRKVMVSTEFHVSAYFSWTTANFMQNVMSMKSWIRLVPTQCTYFMHCIFVVDCVAYWFELRLYFLLFETWKGKTCCGSWLLSSVLW